MPSFLENNEYSLLNGKPDGTWWSVSKNVSCPKVDVRLLSSHWVRLFSALMDDVRIDAQGRLRQAPTWG